MSLVRTCSVVPSARRADDRRADLLATAMEQLLAWAAQGRVQQLPVTCHPVEPSAEAHRALELGTTVGKLVLTVEDPS